MNYIILQEAIAAIDAITTRQQHAGLAQHGLLFGIAVIEALVKTARDTADSRTSDGGISPLVRNQRVWDCQPGDTARKPNEYPTPREVS